ncbi:hypothetical protein SUGI_0442470 [Cryptomeria japonica]|uniref:uncharacterized protein LOC131027490 n=1 Tax=Cryptomeria japonica TaxID=3369 RepID=UPI0024089F5F|nr:uncharacterized protein LOC131027490 [Cryptomeria japonica]GLJ23386.1 hypothetical protein SUGI_0442470 [Cryptomeria japonica]
MKSWSHGGTIYLILMTLGVRCYQISSIYRALSPFAALQTNDFVCSRSEIESRSFSDLSRFQFEAMATFFDGFNPSFDLDCPAISSENACSVMDEMLDFEASLYVEDMPAFKVPPYASTETSWHSNSSDDLQSAEGFNQSAVDSLPCSQSMCTQTAFCKYIKANQTPAVDFFKSGQLFHKRCLGVLRKIEKKRKLTRQISMQTAPPPPLPQLKQSKSAIQNKSAIDHMLAERNRRVKLRQHFANLCSLVPKITKNDKHSILANTTSYLQELKLRVAELEQQNQILQESVSTNKEEGSRRFKSTEQSYNSDNRVIYRSDEVTLEQWKENPWKVNLKIIIKKDKVFCPASLLIKQLDLLRSKQLEVLSIQSQTEPFQFRSEILLRPNGEAWDVSKWQNFATTIRESLL